MLIKIILAVKTHSTASIYLSNDNLTYTYYLIDKYPDAQGWLKLRRKEGFNLAEGSRILNYVDTCLHLYLHGEENKVFRMLASDWSKVI